MSRSHSAAEAITADSLLATFTAGTFTAEQARTHAATARLVVRRAVDGLVLPNDPTERERLGRVVGHLEACDGHRALAVMEEPQDGYGGPFARLYSWIAGVLVVPALTAAACVIAGGTRLLQGIRQLVRLALTSLPTAEYSARWLLPAEPVDETAAYVASIILHARSALLYRPWVWDGLPPQGRFLLIGQGRAQDAKARHPRCDGAHDFSDLVPRLASG
ncbi:hypothetical protein LBMAG53_09820 [Planctomycetota bacterium]|nr:hypothetical protein LBMAG53_09820 [Planctomycetota bacterium]